MLHSNQNDKATSSVDAVLHRWPTVDIEDDGRLIIRYPDGFVETHTIPLHRLEEFRAIASPKTEG